MSQASDRRGVLVVQPLPGIGDMVWHLPHLLAIARHEPEGRVSVPTKPRSLSGPVTGQPARVAEALWVERKPGRHDGLRGFLRLVSELRHKRYRKVWILHDSSRYLVAAWLAGYLAAQALRQDGSGCCLPIFRSPRSRVQLHTVERADCLLRGLAVEPDRPIP